MNKFLKECCIFIILLAICFSAFVLICYLCGRYEKNLSNNNIYIWGDSQAYQGVILSDLARITNKDVLSAATHGAGVYDLLVFANRVPSQSICIVSYSQCCLLRRKSADFNGSGVDIEALYSLYNQHYTIKELFQICTNNYFSKKCIFRIEDSNLYDYLPYIIYPEPLSGFEKMYQTIPAFYNDKYDLFCQALQIMKCKQCQIILIAFPYYETTCEVYKQSPFSDILDQDILQASNILNVDKIDTLYFNDMDSLCMHDLTHLNNVGAQRTTKIIGNYVNEKLPMSENAFVIFNAWKCSALN